MYVQCTNVTDNLSIIGLSSDPLITVIWPVLYCPGCGQLSSPHVAHERLACTVHICVFPHTQWAHCKTWSGVLGWSWVVISLVDLMAMMTAMNIQFINMMKYP